MWCAGRLAIVSRALRASRGFHSKHAPPLLDVLEWRGLMQACTSSALKGHLATTNAQGAFVPRTMYAGVDPSATSMHVGNLLPLIVLLHSALYGHTALVLVGGATGTVGDPSGRSTERPALKAAQLQQNVAGIRAQMVQFFHNAAKYLERRGKLEAEASLLGDATEDLAGKPLFRRGMDIRILDNLSWFQNVSFLEFLRRVGRFARVNDMVARDSVKTRLGPVDGAERSDAPGLSFTEFTYQLMQAHDFSVLHDDPWRCSVQVGGSDQMGNISAGIDLIRRQRAANNQKSTMKDEPAYGLTIPLLTTESGTKFGKSAGNAVWISSEKCSDLDFYQYFIRSADADVARYLRSLTLLSQSEIEAILEEHAKDKSKRIAQTRLAEEMTELVRGDDALQRAQLATQILFSIKVHDLTLDQVRFAFGKDPRLVHVPRSLVDADILRIITESKLLPSRNEARRLLLGGGLYVNGVQVKDPQAKLDTEQLIDGHFVVLRAGKANHKITLFT